MDKFTDIELQLLRIIFPPNGDIPLARINEIRSIRYYLGLAIKLAQVGSQAMAEKKTVYRQDNDKLNQEIVQLRDAGMLWKYIAQKTGLSNAAVRKRYRRMKEEHPTGVRARMECIHQGLPFGTMKLCTLTNSPCTGSDPEATIYPQDQDCFEPRNDRLEIEPDPRASSPNALPEEKEPPGEQPPLQIPSTAPRTTSTSTPQPDPDTETILEVAGLRFPAKIELIPPAAPEATVQPAPESSPGEATEAQGEPEKPATQATESPSGPKIPHEYDEQIWTLSRQGSTGRFILKTLRQAGIQGINKRDVDARIMELARAKAKERPALSPADEMILKMANDHAFISEICVALNRNHNENLTTTQMVQRIADIRKRLKG